MPVLLSLALGLLPPWAWQLVIIFLKQVGAISWASALSLRLYLFLKEKAAKVKTFHKDSDFPHPFPGRTNVSNINKT